MYINKKIAIILIFLAFLFIPSSNNTVNTFNESKVKGVEDIKLKSSKYDISYKTKDIEKLNEESKSPNINIDKERQKSVSYNREDVTQISRVTKEELKEVFNNYTGASTMVNLADALVDAESIYGVNAFTMAAIVALESGFATSRRAIEDNNLTGYEVYSDDSQGRLFPSQYESILQTARHLSENYLNEEGIYYEGLSVDDIQINYCPDEGKNKKWEVKVDKIASGFLEVYKNLFL